MNKTIKQWLNAAADMLMPRLCPVCHKALDGDETWLCRDCLAALPRTRYEEVDFNTMEQHFAGIVPVERATAYFFYEKGSPYASILHDIKYHHTPRMGHWLAMRAVSEDNGAAQLMGINVNSTISMTFAIGSALAAIAGVLLCSSYPALMPTTGAMPGIKAFTAAVFGGIGSIPGAMLGGILIGVIEIFGRAYISSELSDAIVFGVLIIVLLVKPSGLLGKKITEKV